MIFIVLTIISYTLFFLFIYASAMPFSFLRGGKFRRALTDDNEQMWVANRKFNDESAGVDAQLRDSFNNKYSRW